MNGLEDLNDVDEDVLEHVNGNVLEDADNVDVGVGRNFYVFRRHRRERKPRQSIKFVRSFVHHRVVLESSSLSAKTNPSERPPMQHRNTTETTHLNQPFLPFHFLPSFLSIQPKLSERTERQTAESDKVHFHSAGNGVQ